MKILLTSCGLIASALITAGHLVQGAIPVASPNAVPDALSDPGAPILLAQFRPAPSPTDEQQAQLDLNVRLRAKVASGEISQAEAVAALRKRQQPRNTVITDPADIPNLGVPAPTRETEGSQQSDNTRRAIGASRVRAGSATVAGCAATGPGACAPAPRR